MAAFGQQTPTAPETNQPQQRQPIRPQITMPDENASSVVRQNSRGQRIVEIPLLDCSGLPCVEMTSGSGKTLRLLIDTGDANSYLDVKAAQTLGLTLQALPGSGDSTASQVQQTVVPGAKLGDLPMGDFPFMVLDTTPEPNQTAQKVPPLPADGALTYNAFQNRLLEIDFPRKLVRISEPEEAPASCPHACSNLIRKHFGGYGPVTLTADGFTIDGQPVDSQIDTLFTGTMLVYPASLEKLGLKKQAKAKHKEFFPFTQGGLKLSRFDGATESFRDLPLMQNAPIYFITADDHPPNVSFDATVGSGLLGQAIVSFDFKGMHMWIDAGTPPPAPAGGAPQR